MDDLNFDSSTQVQLYIYDLTQGMSAMMSQMLLGRHIEGIWHTAIVVFGKEFFYGSQGIQSCEPVSIFKLEQFSHGSCKEFFKTLIVCFIKN